jgi:THO complex subunit 5
MDGNSGTGTPPRPPVPDVLLDGLRTLVNKGSNVQTTTPLVSGTLFARLKALNRAATASVQAHKALAAEARVEMDQTQLGLQNLQYEKRHLEREIEKCRQFA